MTTVNNINSSSERSLTTGNKQTLDKDAFLKLLVTQLSNQDPLKPMEDKEFIAQMAQFSTLEQIQNMNKTITEVGYEISDQISYENAQMLVTNKEILQELINLNNAIKEYGISSQNDGEQYIEGGESTDTQEV